MRRTTLLAACGGFLLSTLWFDLMFDVQVLSGPAAPLPLPEATIASIATYYRRVTTDAHPMGSLVGVVMMTAVIGSVIGLREGTVAARLAVVSSVAPIGLAGLRVLPNAVALGAGAGSLEERSALARAICTDHLICFAAMLVFTAIHVTRRVR